MYFSIGNENEQCLANPTHYSGNLNLEEFDAQVKSMMEKSQNIIQSGSNRMRAEICKVCGKEGHPQAIRDHIEVNHLEGIVLPCNRCASTFKTRVGLRTHANKAHAH